MPAHARIVIQQTIIPDYRLGVFGLLRDRLGDTFDVYAGEADFGGSPKSSPSAWNYYTKVQNRYVLGSRLLWQSGVIRRLIVADVTILSGNLRILSNIPVLILRRILGRRTLIWGHASGKSKTAKLIRRYVNRLANGIIAYTRSDCEMILKDSPSSQVWVASNSCVFAKDCTPVPISSELPDSFIYVGRLVEAKKVRVLLGGFSRAVSTGLIPQTAKLTIVGDGPTKGDLVECVSKAGLSEQVCFTGHVSSVEHLREFYASAIASVSPGYVGLSATQSFSFGVPMLISKDEHHSPEIEACQEGFNAIFFQTDNLSDMANTLKALWHQRSEWAEKRADIAAWTKQNYSFEAMSRAFISAVEGDR